MELLRGLVYCSSWWARASCRVHARTTRTTRRGVKPAEDWGTPPLLNLGRICNGEFTRATIGTAILNNQRRVSSPITHLSYSIYFLSPSPIIFFLLLIVNS
jgi:hypothetical protein